jgi:hypothetical protein
MRSLLALVAVAFATHAAAAGPATGTKPAKPARSPAASTAAAPSPCKRVVVGRGLDRHVVCEFTAPVVVKADVPKPKVVIVPRDGRSVTGPPRSEDRLVGLSHHLN